MSITPDGWLSWAERVPGPVDKVYSQPNTAQGYVPHSAVGWYGGWLSRLFSTERLPNGRYTPYAAASVHGFIFSEGKVIQHYPFTVSCWANGNRRANTNYVAFENEGGFDPLDEPLTPAQVAANARIIRELVEWRPWTPRRPTFASDGPATLLEHHECVELWGGHPTACPSKRMLQLWDEVLDRLSEEEESDMLRLLKKPGSAAIWATDLITRRRVGSQDILDEMRAKGLAPQGFEEVSADLLDSIPIVPDGGPA